MRNFKVFRREHFRFFFSKNKLANLKSYLTKEMKELKDLLDVSLYCGKHLLFSYSKSCIQVNVKGKTFLQHPTLSLTRLRCP